MILEQNPQHHHWHVLLSTEGKKRNPIHDLYASDSKQTDVHICVIHRYIQTRVIEEKYLCVGFYFFLISMQIWLFSYLMWLK